MPIKEIPLRKLRKFGQNDEVEHTSRQIVSCSLATNQTFETFIRQ